MRALSSAMIPFRTFHKYSRRCLAHLDLQQQCSTPAAFIRFLLTNSPITPLAQCPRYDMMMRFAAWGTRRVANHTIFSAADARRQPSDFHAHAIDDDAAAAAAAAAERRQSPRSWSPYMHRMSQKYNGAKAQKYNGAKAQRTRVRIRAPGGGATCAAGGGLCPAARVLRVTHKICVTCYTSHITHHASRITHHASSSQNSRFTRHASPAAACVATEAF